MYEQKEKKKQAAANHGLRPPPSVLPKEILAEGLR